MRKSKNRGKLKSWRGGAPTAMSMTSSNTPKAEKKKTKNGEISITERKAKNDGDLEKEKEKKEKKEKNKKLKLSNGDSKRRGEKEKVEGDGEEAKTHAFPMARIKTMVKGEDPDLRVTQEAVLAINKAAEKFLEQFAQDAYACSVQDRKKSLNYRHLARVVSKQRRYDFLSDFVPEKMKAEDALRERNLGGNGGV